VRFLLCFIVPLVLLWDRLWSARGEREHVLHIICWLSNDSEISQRPGKVETGKPGGFGLVRDMWHVLSLSPVRLLMALMGRLPGTMPARSVEASSWGLAGVSIRDEAAEVGRGCFIA